MVRALLKKCIGDSPFCRFLSADNVPVLSVVGGGEGEAVVTRKMKAGISGLILNEQRAWADSPSLRWQTLTQASS